MPDDTQTAVPRDTATDRFQRLEETEYERVNEFLKNRVAFTAREWAIARLCADFRTKTGVEMTTIGEHLPELAPFMDEPYTRQAVYQARRSFEEKTRESAATFMYGAFCDFFTADELDEILFEATETATFLLEVEGATLAADEELGTEDQVRTAMAAVRRASTNLRYDRCPHCDEELDGEAT